MSKSRMSIRQWVENFDNGLYADKSTDTQIEAGWYDWFCKDRSLQRKTVYLGKKLKVLLKSKKFDQDKCYVFFKNNCPVSGRLYDDFRICDIETGNVIYTITPASGHKCSFGVSEV